MSQETVYVLEHNGKLIGVFESREDARDYGAGNTIRPTTLHKSDDSDGSGQDHWHASSDRRF